MTRIGKNFQSNGIPYPATQFVRSHNAVLAATLTSAEGRVTWESDAASRLIAFYVSANWFTELGHAATLGSMSRRRCCSFVRAAIPPICSHRCAKPRALPTGACCLRPGSWMGTAAGLGAGWLLAREPFYLQSSGVLMPVLIVLFFAPTAGAAAVLPAARALGVEPLRALRHE